MSENQQMPLGLYIQNSLKGAWKLVQARPNAMEYFDLSSDGFWKSFWAIAVMLPAYFLWTFFNLQGEGVELINGTRTAYPYLSHGIFCIITLPLTAFVMIYFTKWMNISANYTSMVIAYNWMTALKFSILTCFRIILSSGLMSAELSYALLIMLQVYFGVYVVWFTLKNSLKISGMLGVGVFIFVYLLDEATLALLLQIFNPEYIDDLIQSANNPPA